MDGRRRPFGEAHDLHLPVRRRGFTLLELMIGLTLGAFVVLGVQVAWWNTTKAVVQGTSQLDLQRDAAFVLASVSDAARKAGQVTISNYGTQTSNLLILKTSAGVEQRRFYWNTSDNRIYASTSGGTASIFVQSPVQAFSSSIAGKQLSVSMTFGDTYAQTAGFSTTAWLRN